MTNGALESQSFAVGALRTLARSVAHETLALKLDTTASVERSGAHVFENLRTRVEQSPSVQHLRVRLLIPVVQARVPLVEQSVGRASLHAGERRKGTQRTKGALFTSRSSQSRRPSLGYT